MSKAAVLKTLTAATSGAAALPKPQALPDKEGLPVLDLQELLPDPWSAWAEAMSAELHCPPEYLLASSLGVLSGVLGNRVVIAPDPEASPSWIEPMNIWALLVGDPSTGKTPALEAAKRPLWRIQADLHALNQEAVEKYEAELKAYKEAKKGENPKKPEPPQERSLLIQDATPEKVTELLEANKEGLIVAPDEITGLLATWGKRGREGERQFYLTAWGGLAPLAVNRIGRGSHLIPIATIALVSGVQPEPLKRVVRAGVSGSGADGLVQRFQALVWGRHVPWRRTTEAERAAASNGDPDYWPKVWGRLVRSLYTLPFGPEYPRRTIGLPGERPMLKFSPAAQRLFVEFLEDNAEELRGADCPPMLQSLLGKYPGFAARLAAILHLVEDPGPVVSELALARALALTSVFLSHTKEVWGIALEPEDSAIHALAEKLLAKTQGRSFNYARFTLKNVVRQHWRYLSHEAAAREAIEELINLGWLLPAGESLATNPRIFEELT